MMSRVSKGAFDASMTHAVTNYASMATIDDMTSTSIGARYDNGALSVIGAYFRDKVDTTSGPKGRGGQILGVWRVGLGEIKAKWYQYGTTAARASGNQKTLSELRAPALEAHFGLWYVRAGSQQRRCDHGREPVVLELQPGITPHVPKASVEI